MSPELVEVPAGTTAWQQPFDAAITDVVQVQAGVAQQVAHALGVALGAGEVSASPSGQPRTSPPTTPSSAATNCW